MFEDYEEVKGWMDWLMDTLDSMERQNACVILTQMWITSCFLILAV